MTNGPVGVNVRRATVADAAALTRLRGSMFEAMGVTVGGENAEWRKRSRVRAEALPRPGRSLSA
ncbi:hypothetical protein [Sphaerisporangium perillae]|uniref:hypothetical protein n=1 Tax=Sphaerisporangium perillae TaxID=2935860 RepID=UPI00200F9344|nr:hypothetical protein [Sphaerisporangium perillae]